MQITSGVLSTPLKVVIYGPEGIGKSTFAAQAPGALFIDTEGSTARMNVRRLPAPTSFTRLRGTFCTTSMVAVVGSLSSLRQNDT